MGPHTKYNEHNSAITGNGSSMQKSITNLNPIYLINFFHLLHSKITSISTKQSLASKYYN